MLIVPSEKRLDWQHAPLVLLVIVALNILIFFFYQIGDDEKLYSALEFYSDNQFLKTEWPIYQRWVNQGSDAFKQQRLRELVSLYADKDSQEVSIALILDTRFYTYLSSNSNTLFKDNFLSSWRIPRSEINDKVQSISSFAGGLIPDNFRIPNLFTHLFLHGGMPHLLGNLFFLVICGFAVEAALGHLRFLLFYLTGGVGAGLSHTLMDPSSQIPLIGASGAISAVMAMYLAIFRFKRIEFFYWFLFFVGYIRAPALLILPVYIGKEVFSYYTDPESGVAFIAHAGGFVVGAVLILGAMRIYPDIINEEYVDADQDSDPQREKLARVYEEIENFDFALAYKYLKELIDEFGLSFELALLRMNIFRLSGSKAWTKCLIALFSFNRLEPHEWLKIQSLWFEYPRVVEKMDDKALVDLGMRMASLPNLEPAKAIYQQLLKNECQYDGVGILNKKIQYQSDKLESSP